MLLNDHPWLCGAIIVVVFAIFAAGELVGFRIGRKSACRDWSFCERLSPSELLDW